MTTQKNKAEDPDKNISVPVVPPSDPTEGQQMSEFIVSVSAVLETAKVNQTARWGLQVEPDDLSNVDLGRTEVMDVVNRLVDHLNKVETEKKSTALQLKGKL